MAKTAYAEHLGISGVPLHCSASLTAGFVYSVATLPLDTAKTRMQNQAPGPDGKLPYTSLPQTLGKIACKRRATPSPTFPRALKDFACRAANEGVISYDHLTVLRNSFPDSDRRFRCGCAGCGMGSCRTSRGAVGTPSLCSSSSSSTRRPPHDTGTEALPSAAAVDNENAACFCTTRLYYYSADRRVLSITLVGAKIVKIKGLGGGVRQRELPHRAALELPPSLPNLAAGRHDRPRHLDRGLHVAHLDLPVLLEVVIVVAVGGARVRALPPLRRQRAEGEQQLNVLAAQDSGLRSCEDGAAPTPG